MAGDVSILLPTYQRADYLQKTIQSILAQEDSGFTLLVQDNHSTDHTWDVVQSFARQDNRVLAVRNPQNIGMMANYNSVLARVQTPWAVLAADDDPWLPHRLGVLRDLLGSGEGVSAVYTDWALIGPDDEPLQTDRQRARRKSPPPDNRGLRHRYHCARLLDSRIIVSLFRTALFKDRPLVSPLVGQAGSFADGALVLTLLYGGEVRYSPTVTLLKRENIQKEWTGHRVPDAEQYLLYTQTYLAYAHQAMGWRPEPAIGLAQLLVARWGMGRLFRRNLFKLYRQYPQKVSAAPRDVAAFELAMRNFARQRGIRFGRDLLWLSASLWPRVAPVFRALGLVDKTRRTGGAP